jgi:hypothetical protein
MALQLIYAVNPEERGSSGVDAALVDAADAAAARAAALAARPNGECHPDRWTGQLELADAAGASFPVSGVIFIQGNIAHPLQRYRGE